MHIRFDEQFIAAHANEADASYSTTIPLPAALVAAGARGSSSRANIEYQLEIFYSDG